MKDMECPRCKAVLIFESNKYFQSYATLLELLYSQTNQCTLSPRESKKPIVPIVLENIDMDVLGADDGDTGLGEKSFNANAGTEKALFNKTYKQVYNKYSLWCAEKEREDAIDGLYEPSKENKGLKKNGCARIMRGIIEFAGANENKFIDNDEFYEDLKNTIESVAPTAFADKNAKKVSSDGMLERWLNMYKSDEESWNPDFEKRAEEGYDGCESYEEAFNDYYQWQNIKWNSSCADGGLVWGLEEFAKDFYGIICSVSKGWTPEQNKEFDSIAAKGFLGENIDMSDIESYNEADDPVTADVAYVLTTLTAKTGHPNFKDNAMKSIRSNFMKDFSDCMATYKDVLDCACMILSSLGYEV